MGMNNIQLYNLAKTYLGKGGAIFRSYCGLGRKDPYCNAYVTYVLHKGDDALLYCNGKKMTYCPTSIKWCYNNLANIPIYLAMPMDIIYFDWELNGTPNHIGFVRQRKSDVEVYTIEGNTSGGIVANKVRVGKYVQAVFRPHFQATFDTSKPLVVDGQFDYSSVAMLQLALGIKVDGILGKDTVKMLQKVAGVSQDGSWGKNTSKAVQKMVGAKVDGAWGVESTKALQKWINSKVKPQPTPAPTPTPSGKLDIDGHGGVATVKAMQRFFGTTQDGVISGQKKDLQSKYFPALEAVGFGNGGSACVKNLQRWVGVNQDGVIGSATVKAWQKKISVKDDGCFGADSMKAWQKYLNEHERAVYPTPAKTAQDKACDWAKKIASDNSYIYVPQTSNDSPANHCCICNGIKSGKYHGWNCIRFVGASYYHGAGVKIKSADHKLVTTDMANKMLKGTNATAQKIWTDRNGDGWTVIRNGNKKLPTSMLKKGDVLICYDKEGSSACYKHMAMYVGDSKIVDSANKSIGISVRNYTSLGSKCLLALRYTK